MKLYMKQKVFSVGDQFTVWDANGNEKYFVQGDLISFGLRLHINDTTGTERAFLKQKFFSLLPTFYVYRGQEEIAEIKKEFTFFMPKYTVSGLDWEVSGDFFHHDYQITKHGRPIVTISKTWLSWGDTYELDIDDGQDEVIALAVVLAIDCVLDAQERASD